MNLIVLQTSLFVISIRYLNKEAALQLLHLDQDFSHEEN
jgi:hypothetical protein